MKAISYYCSLPFIYLIAILPFPVVYFISDIFFVILYYVVGYRRETVILNLENAFPEKNNIEINSIARKYYRHLCDVILETFKLPGMSSKEIIKRCNIGNYGVYRDLLVKGHKSVVIALGHQGNWEWLSAGTALQGDAPLQVIYRPLSNRYFDRLMFRIRSKFGAIPVTANNILRMMYSNNGVVTGTAFLADQTPQPEVAYWLKFLNQDTAVYNGTEKIARKFNYPVIFVSMTKVRRGYYEVEVHMVSPDPSKTAKGEITGKHTRLLEQSIIAQPETWLWSHRRWKHTRNTKSPELL